ncbi:MAG: ribonuclease domain-containing protein [Clostridia bacterium]
MCKHHWQRLISLILAALVVLCCAAPALAAGKTIVAEQYPVTENGAYQSMEEVAVYLSLYGRLPSNFLTKKQAEALGWNSRAGNLGEVAPGCAIGGDHFGNYEGVLPDAKGRKWTECDIHFDGGYRGGERIAFSNDGLIYYSDDHYQSFTQLKVVLDEAAPSSPEDGAVKVKKNGEYTDKDEVAAYLHQYGTLPANYLTKKEAKALGWSNKKDNLGKAAPGCAIGGDLFRNREKLLPQAKSRQWRECDVNVQNGKRGKERIVYSNDGLIYYSPDNHKTFTKLY